MFVEVVAIGDEILSGNTVNTNAAFISHHLTRHGWKVTRHTCLSDTKETLAKELKIIIDRAHIVIMTGGLGPTEDDITRNALETLFQSPSAYNGKVAQEIEKRFGKELSSLNNVATIPCKATPLINPIGTAPGLLFHEQNCIVIALPGVPQEMQALFIDQVLPYLHKTIPPKSPLLYAYRNLCLLTEDAVDPLIRTWKQKDPSVSVGIYPHYGFLQLSLSSRNQNALDAFAAHIDTTFPTHLFQNSLEQAIHNICIDKKHSLALAESCTGGEIAASLIKIPGSSAYFLGSLVVYSNILKEKLIDVPSLTIAHHGAVSAETACAMLEGLFTKTPADYGIAVTGIAGPDGGSKEKPVGTVWIAIGKRGAPCHTGKILVKGATREKVILYAKNSALAHLYRLPRYNITPF